MITISLKTKLILIIFRPRRWREFLDWFHSVDSDSFDPFVPGLATSDWLHQHTAMGKRHMTWVRRENVRIFVFVAKLGVCVSREKKPGGGGGRKWHLHKKRCRKEKEEGMEKGTERGCPKGEISFYRRETCFGSTYNIYTVFPSKRHSRNMLQYTDKIDAKFVKSFIKKLYLLLSRDCWPGSER